MQQLRQGGDSETGASEKYPVEFALDQNYPNPFNSETTIRFRIPEDMHVRLTVDDDIGQETHILIQQNLPAGVHTVRWNGKNLPGGVYYYTLAAGRYTAMRTMVLIK